VAVACIVAGVVLSIENDLSNSGSSKIWAVILVISSVFPSAIGILIMDAYLKGHGKINHFVMWSWIYAAQFIAGFGLLPALLPLNGVPLSEASSHLRSGFECFFLAKDNPSAPDQCESAIIWFLLGWADAMVLVFTLSQVVQRDSAMVVALAQVCAIPLANILFTFKFLMGEYAVTLRWEDYVAIALVTGGILFYKSTHEKRKSVIESSLTH